MAEQVARKVKEKVTKYTFFGRRSKDNSRDNYGDIYDERLATKQQEWAIERWSSQSDSISEQL